MVISPPFNWPTWSPNALWNCYYLSALWMKVTANNFLPNCIWSNKCKMHCSLLELQTKHHWRKLHKPDILQHAEKKKEKGKKKKKDNNTKKEWEQRHAVIVKKGWKELLGHRWADPRLLFLWATAERGHVAPLPPPRRDGSVRRSRSCSQGISIHGAFLSLSLRRNWRESMARESGASRRWSKKRSNRMQNPGFTEI